MGNSCLGNSDSQKKSKDIDRQLRQDANTDSHRLRILLLGAGESGKSTLFKQMRLLYSDQKKFSEEEFAQAAKIINANIVSDMRVLLSASKTHVPITNKDNKKLMKKVLAWDKARSIGESEAQILAQLWQDEGVKGTWKNRGDLQVQDALEYYMKSIRRIGAPGWKPTNMDILRSRARTSGVVEEKFSAFGGKFDMIDVGGQRNERRKWINQFANVTTVLFVAAISEYNQFLYEDPTVRRQDEAVQLFRKQVEEDCFVNTAFILFLNKVDLFREKLVSVPFRLIDGDKSRNEDFQGPHIDLKRKYNYETVDADADYEACYMAALKYLVVLYESQCPPKRGAEPQIYCHPTNSTDSANVERIMTACKDIILKDNLTGGGWL